MATYKLIKFIIDNSTETDAAAFVRSLSTSVLFGNVIKKAIGADTVVLWNNNIVFVLPSSTAQKEGESTIDRVAVAKNRESMARAIATAIDRPLSDIFEYAKCERKGVSIIVDDNGNNRYFYNSKLIFIDGADITVNGQMLCRRLVVNAMNMAYSMNMVQ